MKITLDGNEYELNFDRAIVSGVLSLLKKKIISFDVGDVFSNEDHAQIVVVQPVYEYPHGHKKVYGFIGNGGGFGAYSNITGLMTYDEVIKYLNDHELEFKGNLSELLTVSLRSMVGNQFCP